MKITCPNCAVSFSLDVALNDECARELMTLFIEYEHLYRPLAMYLGLFRPATRKLEWRRALKVAQDVIAIGSDERMRNALIKTVDNFREKKDRTPLKNNNYLKRVYEGEPSVVATVASSQSTNVGALSKTMSAIEVLQNKKR